MLKILKITHQFKFNPKKKKNLKLTKINLHLFNGGMVMIHECITKKKSTKKKGYKYPDVLSYSKKKKKRTYKDQIIIIPSPLIHETPTVTDKNRTKKIALFSKKRKRKKNRTKKIYLFSISSSFDPVRTAAKRSNNKGAVWDLRQRFWFFFFFCSYLLTLRDNFYCYKQCIYCSHIVHILFMY